MSNDRVMEGDLALISKHRNALMGIAAIIICAFHEFLPVFPSATAIGAAESFILRVSYYGVDFFLLLSGMSVAFSLLKDSSVLSFYKKRAVRILPFYLLSALFMFWTKDWTITDYILNVSGIRFFTESVNAYMWFVIAIIIFYLFAPLYNKLILKTGKPVITFFATLAVWYIFAIIMNNFVREDLYYMINRIPIFLIGITLGHLIYSRKQVSSKMIFWLAIASAYIIGWLLSYCCNYYLYDPLFGLYLRFVPMFMLGISTAYISAKILDLIKFSFVEKALAFIGGFSFEFYCVQIIFDVKLHDFIRSFDIWGVPRNILMFVILGAVAWGLSKVVDLLVKAVIHLFGGKSDGVAKT